MTCAKFAFPYTCASRIAKQESNYGATKCSFLFVLFATNALSSPILLLFLFLSISFDLSIVYKLYLAASHSIASSHQLASLTTLRLVHWWIQKSIWIEFHGIIYHYNRCHIALSGFHRSDANFFQLNHPYF